MKEKQTKTGTRNPYDLTEETSKRGSDASTTESRRAENDAANEERNTGNVSGPEGDSSAENKVATLDD